MSIGRTRELLVELALGPAGLDVLDNPGSIAIGGDGRGTELERELRRRIEEVGGKVARTPVAPDGVVVLKTPALTSPISRAGFDELGRWLVKQTVIPCPTEDWARRIWPAEDDALERLWAAVRIACRLDSDDPVAAWRARHAELRRRAAWLVELELDSLRFVDPLGTDLSIGLLAPQRWLNGRAESRRGERFVPNVPCEEIFSAPDPSRVQGRAVIARPVVHGELAGRGVELEFRLGEEVSIRAAEGEAELRNALSGEGARHLGEVALVDRESRAGRLGVLFEETMLDENAACHIALGGAIPGSYDHDRRDAANESPTHLDVVIGTPDTRVVGYARDGSEIELLAKGEWVLDR